MSLRVPVALQYMSPILIVPRRQNSLLRDWIASPAEHADQMHAVSLQGNSVKETSKATRRNKVQVSLLYNIGGSQLRRSSLLQRCHPNPNPISRGNVLELLRS